MITEKNGFPGPCLCPELCVGRATDSEIYYILNERLAADTAQAAEAAVAADAAWASLVRS